MFIFCSQQSIGKQSSRHLLKIRNDAYETKKQNWRQKWSVVPGDWLYGLPFSLIQEENLASILIATHQLYIISKQTELYFVSFYTIIQRYMFVYACSILLVCIIKHLNNIGNFS